MARDENADALIEDTVLRRNNRILRYQYSKTRRQLQDLREEKEELFQAVCTIETEAERAMRELWTKGHFDCGPQDYDGIVERSLEALYRLEELAQ